MAVVFTILNANSQDKVTLLIINTLGRVLLAPTNVSDFVKT